MVVPLGIAWEPIQGYHWNSEICPEDPFSLREQCEESSADIFWLAWWDSLESPWMSDTLAIAIRLMALHFQSDSDNCFDVPHPKCQHFPSILHAHVDFGRTLIIIPSMSMFIPNGFQSLHFHVAISRITTKNWCFRLDKILWTSCCCERWFNQYRFTLYTQ
jgi:hypothetical protein